MRKRENLLKGHPQVLVGFLDLHWGTVAWRSDDINSNFGELKMLSLGTALLANLGVK
jgi:hypothetical protein